MGDERKGVEWFLRAQTFPKLLPLSLSFSRSEVDPDSPQHEADARRLFEGMLQALSDVRKGLKLVDT